MDGDLGLGTDAHLDICTGTAVCTMAADVASSSSVDAQEGSEKSPPPPSDSSEIVRPP